MESIETQHLRHFCNLHGLNFPAASGVRPLPGGGTDQYSIDVIGSCKSDQVAALAINPVGRFGNNVHQLINACQIANGVGARRIFWNGELKPVSDGRKAALPALLDRSGFEGLVLTGGYFYSFTFSKYIRAITSAGLVEIVKDVLHPIYGIEPKLVGGKQQICVHVRSGDLFLPNPNRWYIQPPLGFYLQAVEFMLKKHGEMPVLVVYEDTNNPVVEPLLENLKRAGVDLRCRQPGSFLDDCRDLLDSKYLVVGKGSFVPALAILSMQKEGVACFNKFGNAGHEYSRHATRNLYTFEDSKGDYIKRDWENSPAQREKMVDYPREYIKVI